MRQNITAEDKLLWCWTIVLYDV